MNYPIITIDRKHKNYPKPLLEIHDSPEILYCRGNLKLLNSACFSVVGTRKLTSYGKEAARLITGELARNGFTIVSGLALGIDAVAHKAALDCDAKTIAVLGTGIDDRGIYPETNFGLAQEILKKGGLIISEYSIGTPGLKHQFPERNRIISGLSVGVLIVEADKKSGSLITAECALDQNRDVFAVPGSIFSSKSIGPNTLVQKGAKLVTSANDILEEYGQNPQLFEAKKITLSTKDPIQIKILDILDIKGPVPADEIIRESGEETQKVTTALSMLEIGGYIKITGEGKYQKI